MSMCELTSRSWRRRSRRLGRRRRSRRLGRRRRSRRLRRGSGRRRSTTTEETTEDAASLSSSRRRSRRLGRRRRGRRLGRRRRSHGLGRRRSWRRLGRRRRCCRLGSGRHRSTATEETAEDGLGRRGRGLGRRSRSSLGRGSRSRLGSYKLRPITARSRGLGRRSRRRSRGLGRRSQRLPGGRRRSRRLGSGLGRSSSGLCTTEEPPEEPSSSWSWRCRSCLLLGRRGLGSLPGRCIGDFDNPPNRGGAATKGATQALQSLGKRSLPGGGCIRRGRRLLERRRGRRLWRGRSRRLGRRSWLLGGRRGPEARSRRLGSGLGRSSSGLCTTEEPPEEPSSSWSWRCRSCLLGRRGLGSFPGRCIGDFDNPPNRGGAATKGATQTLQSLRIRSLPGGGCISRGRRLLGSRPLARGQLLFTHFLLRLLASFDSRSLLSPLGFLRGKTLFLDSFLLGPARRKGLVGRWLRRRRGRLGRRRRSCLGRGGDWCLLAPEEPAEEATASSCLQSDVSRTPWKVSSCDAHDSACTRLQYHNTPTLICTGLKVRV
jgi:hypothetical protein